MLSYYSLQNLYKTFLFVLKLDTNLEHTFNHPKSRYLSSAKIATISVDLELLILKETSCLLRKITRRSKSSEETIRGLEMSQNHAFKFGTPPS